MSDIVFGTETAKQFEPFQRGIRRRHVRQVDRRQPVIEMPTGAHVEVVFLDGTFIRN